MFDSFRAFSLKVPAVAQKIYVYPATVTAPRGSYQTVTAIVTGVNDKTVTWTSDGGTIAGTNPCIVNEPCTVALTTTTPGTYHLTAKSNANSSGSCDRYDYDCGLTHAGDYSSEAGDYRCHAARVAGKGDRPQPDLYQHPVTSQRCADC